MGQIPLLRNAQALPRPSRGDRRWRRIVKSGWTPPPSTDEPSYEVGYRKPPAASQFKPGQSGNSRGDPKGAQNKRPALNEERRKAIVIDEAYRTIKVSEGRRQIMIPMAQAVTRALAVNTARGQLRSQQMFANLLSEVESANKAPRTSGFERRSNIKSIGSENWSAARS